MQYNDLEISERLDVVITLESTCYGDTAHAGLTSLTAIAYRGGIRVSSYDTLIMPPEWAVWDEKATIGSKHTKEYLETEGAMEYDYARKYFKEFVAGLIDGSIFLEKPIPEGFYIVPVVQWSVYTMNSLYRFLRTEPDFSNQIDVSNLAELSNNRARALGKEAPYKNIVSGEPSVSINSIASGLGLKPTVCRIPRAELIWECFTTMMVNPDA